MDTATLVDEQIVEGKSLVNQLKERHFPVSAAFWVLTSDEGLWFLFIASPVVDEEGLAAAYRRVNTELSRCGVRGILRTDIKVVGVGDPIAIDAMKYRSNAQSTRYGGRKLGNLIVEEAYIYPD
jgi:hypothetical protein